MGLLKNKMMEEEAGHYEDSTGIVAINGGYLDIQLDGETIATVSIPRPNFMADSHVDSVVNWSEDFEDFDGNIYKAEVKSSMHGIDWTIDIEPNVVGTSMYDEILQSLYGRIKIDIVPTEEN